MAESKAEILEREAVTPKLTLVGRAALSPAHWSQLLAKVSRRSAQADVDAAPLTASGGRRYLLSFLILVAAPAIIATLYLALIASDQYAAEARFAVVSSKYELSSDKIDKLKSAMKGAGGGGMANQDAYMVAAYIRSRAAIDDVSKTLNLREIFRRPGADFWARLDQDPTAERLLAYWRSMVSAYIDAPSGIVTVTVKAFRPEDAVAVCRAVVEASEALANAVSARSRQYTTKIAEAEVDRSEKRVVASLADLKALREKVGLIDPTSEAKQTGLILTELLGQRIHLESEYSVSTQAMSIEAPTVQALKTRLDMLDKQIAVERGKLTGAGQINATIASVIPKYEELEVRSQFAQKMYELAGEGLERARLRGEAQGIFIEAFVPPALPEDAEFPQRFWTSLAIWAVLTILWGIGAMAVAVVEDHRV